MDELQVTEKSGTAVRGKAKRTFTSALHELIRLLETEKPDMFSPSFVNRHNRNLFRHITCNYKKEDGAADWGRFIARIDAKWQRRWHLKRKYPELTWETCIDNIRKLMEEQPEKITPTWLKKNARREHSFIIGRLKRKNHARNWDAFLQRCPPVITAIWDHETQRTLNPKTAILLLKRYLAEGNPDSFNSRWIEKKDNGLYLYLKRNFRDRDGVDWKTIINKLPKDLQRKWHHQVRVEALCASYFKSMHEVFFEPLHLSNGKKNELFAALAALSQKNNFIATERLLALLGIYVNDWIINYREMKIYLREFFCMRLTVINFILHFKKEKDAYFLTSLLAHLRQEAKKLQQENQASKNEPDQRAHSPRLAAE